MDRVAVPLAAPLLTDGVKVFNEGSFLELISMNLLSQSCSYHSPTLTTKGTGRAPPLTGVNSAPPGAQGAS